MPTGPSVAEQVERELVREAIAKRQRGERPTRRETQALARFEKDQDEQSRWGHYSSIPKKHYIEMSGRQARTLNEQARRYNLPIGGRVIDLGLTLRAFHDFLAKHGPKLLDTDDPMSVAVNSPSLEEWRSERARIAKMDRLERERILIKREDAHESLARIASMLRNCGDLLEQEFGRDARAILNEAIDDVTSEVSKSFAAQVVSAE